VLIRAPFESAYKPNATRNIADRKERLGYVFEMIIQKNVCQTFYRGHARSDWFNLVLDTPASLRTAAKWIGSGGAARLKPKNPKKNDFATGSTQY
jgi:hypothetical protein